MVKKHYNKPAMEILNLGPLEIIFIILIAFVVLGPEEAIRLAKKAGSSLYRLTRSSTWSSMMSTSREIRELPRKIAKEIELEETMKGISSDLHEISGELEKGGKILLKTEMNPSPVGDENETTGNGSPQ